jgi:hypothetical protein
VEEISMSIVVGQAGAPGTVVVLEGSATADLGDDLIVANADGPDLHLKYGGTASTISAGALVSHWSQDTIYLGFGGQAPGQPRYSLIVLVQRAWRGNWVIHYQLSRQLAARRAA